MSERTRQVLAVWRRTRKRYLVLFMLYKFRKADIDRSIKRIEMRIRRRHGLYEEQNHG